VEKVLDQEQIGAMVRAATGGQGVEHKVRVQGATVWDARQAGQIGRGREGIGDASFSPALKVCAGPGR
jgi:hypothetical protein